MTGLDLPQSTIFTASIVPIVQYKLTDRCSLEAKINIASLAYTYQKIKIDEFNDDEYISNNSFAFGLNNETMVNSIAIGAIWKF